MEKINVLTLGGCAAHDILKSNRNHINLYNIDMWLGSFSRQMWPTDKIAMRLGEEVHSILENIEDPTHKTRVSSQLWHTVKRYRTPSILIENLPPNSIVIVDPAYEIVNFYFDGNEIFDISLVYFSIVQQYMPDWFTAAIKKHYTHYDNGIMELAQFQYRALKKFTKYLNKANVPVIALDNLFTNKVFDYATNSVATAISSYNSRMPFSKLQGSELEKHNYSTDLIDRFYENWRNDIPKEFKLFSPDQNLLYADTEHQLGYHPTHLHHTCRTVLEKELSALIVETVTAHKAKQPLILSNNISKTSLVL